MNSQPSWIGPRIDVRPLFGPQHAAFLELLAGLDAPDWARPTACPGWTVHDVATHVLADYVGRLSIHRDGFQTLHPRGGETLPAFIDRINDEWVVAARRVSPALLLDVLSSVGTRLVSYWSTVDLDALGWPVVWAGPDPAPVWLDAARELTEYWTHHQQIAEATGRPGLTRPEHLAPVLDTFLRALPHTLRDTPAATGTTLRVTVAGPAGGIWTATRAPTRWELTAPSPRPPDALLELDADTAWRLCTRGITPGQAATRGQAQGDRRLTAAALTIVSIIR
jgi:uncharacterized protein (TIGR03083 family)